MTPVPAGLGGPEPTEEWIAVLEFARPDGEAPFLVDDVQTLISHLGERGPSGLWHPDRYAVQVKVSAPNAHEGLQRALAYHDEAARAVSLAAATLVRIEVMTVEEYERSLDLETYDPAETPVSKAAPLGLLCDELYSATRRLHAATCPRELTDTVIRFVITIGGSVEPGAPRNLPGTIDVDITLGADKARHATADALSVAGLIIEQSLPTLLADARQAVARLRDGRPDGEPGQAPLP